MELPANIPLDSGIPLRAPRKKVLFISYWYPTAERPINGVFVREQAKAVQIYDDVTVLHCLGYDSRPARLWNMNEETDARLTQGVPTFRVSYRRPLVPRTAFLAELATMAMAIRKLAPIFRPDIIHAHVYTAAFQATLIGKLAGIPVVVSEHASGYGRNLLSWKDKRLTQLACSWASFVCPVSSGLQMSMRANGIVPNRCRVVPNVVETRLFYPRDHSADDRITQLLTVCLLDESDNKGIPTLLNALKLLSNTRTDWHLHHVGDGPARKRHEMLAAQLGISALVTFHGAKPKTEVAAFMRNASLLIVPSVFETFSVVAAEALACGIPVLATRCGGPEDFVTRDCGILVPPSNPQAMCDALSQMLSNLHIFSPERISQYARDRFSPERVGASFHEIYSRACANAA